MNRRQRRSRVPVMLAAAIALSLTLFHAAAQGQRGGGQRGAAGQRGGGTVARNAAPFDITGYWTALITEDWEYRMVTPAKGAVEFVPLNNAGRAAANGWDPDKDE